MGRYRGWLEVRIGSGAGTGPGGAGREHGALVRSTGETEIIPPGVAGHPIVSAQRNVFLVRSPVKRVGYARLGSTRLADAARDPLVDETTGNISVPN